jgi:hypothetical protein
MISVMGEAIIRLGCALDKTTLRGPAYSYGRT